MLFQEAVEDFMTYVEVTKSNGTARYYRGYCKRLCKYFASYQCSQINRKEILKYIQFERHRNSEISNNTINKSIQTVKAILKYSCGITLNFQKLREQKHTIPLISDRTVRKIFNYYEKHMSSKAQLRNYLYLRILLDTGLRLNEMNNIMIKNIDMMYHTIHVTVTKTDLDRYVLFTNSTALLLKKFLTVVKDNEYLFFNFNTGERLKTNTVQLFISKLKRQLKIKESISPHKWRHTFATRFVRSGGDLETLRMILGHTSLKTTQQYMHLTKMDLIQNYKAVFRHTDSQ